MMLDDGVIIGVTMIVTEVIKIWMKKSINEKIVGQVIPLVVMTLAGVLNVMNGLVFGESFVWREVLSHGLTLGAVAGGVYSMGKSVLGK